MAKLEEEAAGTGLGSAVPCRYCPLPLLSQLAVGLAKLAVAGLVGVLFLIAPRFFLGHGLPLVP